MGMFLYYFKPKFIIKRTKYLKIFSSILVGVVFAIKVVGSTSISVAGLTKGVFLSILPWTLLLNIIGLFLGFTVMKIFKSSNTIATTVGIEVGLQNTLLALLITDVILSQQILGYPALIYSLFSFWTTALFGFLFVKKRNFSFMKNIIQKLY